MTAPTPTPMDHDEAEDLAPLFVLGALDRAASDGVRAHLAECGRPHPEIEELGGVVAHLAATAEPVEPADALRARILAAVRDDGMAGEHEGRGVLDRPDPRAPSFWRLGLWRRALAVGALALVVVLAVTTAQLAGRLADAQAYADQLSQAAVLASAAGSRTATMAAAVPGGPSGVAVVVPAGPGRIVLSGLAPVQGGQVYEVWLIGADGRPVPAGELRTTGAGTGWLDSLAPVGSGQVTVAVTREPGPGATTPTLPILTSGSAGQG